METTAILLKVSKTLNFGMHSDIYEQAWFKLGMVTDISEHLGTDLRSEAYEPISFKLCCFA